MSAPIGRLDIRTSAKKRAPSSVALVQAAEPPCDSEGDRTGAVEEESALPHYYPFAPRRSNDGDD
jgi:hypothetical protein